MNYTVPRVIQSKGRQKARRKQGRGVRATFALNSEHSPGRSS